MSERSSAVLVPEWEIVLYDDAPQSGNRVRRMAVPGGWLYQVACVMASCSSSSNVADVFHYSWHPPVFVPEARS